MREEGDSIQTAQARDSCWRNDVETALAIWGELGPKLEQLRHDPIPDDFSWLVLASQTEQLFALVTLVGKRILESKTDRLPESGRSDEAASSPERPDQDQPVGTHRLQIPEKSFFKIGEVSEILGVEPSIIRYWEAEFECLEPARTRARQRIYHKKEVERLGLIRHLIYNEKFTIPGAKKRLREIDKQKRDQKKAASEGKKAVATDTADVVFRMDLPDQDPPEGQHGLKVPEKYFFKIGEVSKVLQVEPYVLRYWESEFKSLKPTRNRERQRLYTKKDLERLKLIKHLAYDEHFTIPAVKKRLQVIDRYERKRKKGAASEAGKAAEKSEGL